MSQYSIVSLARAMMKIMFAQISALLNPSFLTLIFRLAALLHPAQLHCAPKPVSRYS